MYFSLWKADQIMLTCVMICCMRWCASAGVMRSSITRRSILLRNRQGLTWGGGICEAGVEGGHSL